MRSYPFHWISCALFMFLALTGCAPAAAELATETPPPTATAPASASPAVPPTATVTATAAPPPTASPAPSLPAPSPTAAPQICSPLAGFAIDQLAGMTSNPYHPPAPGSDDPHHGVDIAVRLDGSQVAVKGNPVRAALEGTVAAVIHDRFPYGSAVMIETPLDTYPAEWWSPAAIPAPAPTLALTSALTCPAVPPLPITDPNRRSLYVLYAHLDTIAAVEVGQPVACGAELGTVGDSGNALAPHLHFEARTAPAGLSLSSMAHYDASASAEEMSNYCTWRISGLFQLVDPMRVLSLAP